MAQPPILTLSGVTLGFGGDPLFKGLDLAIHQGERAALVGRNGSGKSTLLKIIAGMTETDSGSRTIKPGARIAYLPQDPDFAGYATLGAYAAADLPPEEAYKADMAMEGLEVSADADPATASGGERRRAALARLLAGEPELMLLDEPTNHLDIRAIEWLEAHLAETRAAFVLISHDRAFLRRLTRSILWLDRGEARRLDRGFEHFEAWRDKTYEEEREARHKLDRLILSEGRWAVEGISARRKRNMGRVRRLQDMRAERARQILQPGVAAMALESGQKSGKLVAEATGISKAFGDRTILRDFSLRIARGDRVALVGPNGAGKTTLLKLLTGELSPDQGDVRIGLNLTPAIFDQTRAALDPDKSLWETLTGDPASAVKGSNDQVMVRGRPRHVVSYLKDFLFDERQARGPVSALSGGERARLLLAKLMARDSNLLVLDEPTNDLDVETLDLLQELLSDYDGTVLLVSHDRDFIDRIAATTIAMEGDGEATVYAGGWSDYQTQRGAASPEKKPAKPSQPAEKAERAPKARSKLSFHQQRRLDDLPAEMERLGAEIEKLEALLSDPDLYARDPKKFEKATEALSTRRAALDAAEMEWLELEELREALAG